jgi:hypothetical protein
MTLADYIHTDIRIQDSRGRHTGGRRTLESYSPATRHSPTTALVDDTLWVVTLADNSRELYSHGR